MSLVPVSEGSMTFGQTALDAGDLVMPRIKVVQAQSAEVADGFAKPGDIWNTLTSENHGTELRFIPLVPFKQRIMLVRPERRPLIDAALKNAKLPPLPEGDGLACRSFDMLTGAGHPGIACDACPLSKWGEANTAPLCSETYNVAAMTELGDLIVLSFSKSSARTGKQLFSMMRLQRTAPYAKVALMQTKQEKGAKGTYYAPTVKMTGEITPPELLASAREWASQLAGARLDIEPDEEGVFEAASATTETPF